MSSTIFQQTVTQVPADWANDVNRLVYELFGAPVSLAELNATLGITELRSGVGAVVVNGSVNGSPVGNTVPSTGSFTRVRVTNSWATANDAVTHSQLDTTVAGIVAGIGTLAAQSSSAISITGGDIDGTSIGATVAGPGVFTSLECDMPTTDTGAVNKQMFDSAFDALPTFGNIVGQSSTDVSFSGGSINGVDIGGNVAATGTFTTISGDKILGDYANVYLDGSGVGAADCGFYVDASIAASDVKFKLHGSSSFILGWPTTTFEVVEGRVCVNTLDDGSSAVQTDGNGRFGGVLLGNTTPALPNSATSKVWVQTVVNAVAVSVPITVAAAITALGDMSHQSSGNVALSGGSIDGVNIGGTVAGHANFTQASAEQFFGSDGTLRVDGTGGLANSGAILSANGSARPNVSVVPSVGGSFAVMAGAQPVLKVGVSGRTIIGVGSDDGNSTLQVHGDAVVNGRLTYAGGRMVGTAVLALGAGAPAVVNAVAPFWVRVRVTILGVDKECVMPAWEVL